MACRPLRRLLLAWAMSYAAELAAFVGLSVYVFQVGGAAAVGALGVARTVPGLALNPLVTRWADRVRRERLLVATVVPRCFLFAAVAAVLWLSGPVLLVIVLVGVCSGMHELFRPLQSAMLPWLVKGPEDLAAANGAAGVVEGLAVLTGPAIGAVLPLVGSVADLVLVSTVLLAAASRLGQARYDGGATVIRQGHVGHTFYLITAGTAEVTVDGVRVRQLHRGDFFGEIGLLRTVARTATVTAASALTLLIVERADFVAAVRGNPDSARIADQIVTDRLSHAARAAPERTGRIAAIDGHTAGPPPGLVTATRTAGLPPGRVTATRTAGPPPGRVTATRTAGLPPGPATATSDRQWLCDSRRAGAVPVDPMRQATVTAPHRPPDDRDSLRVAGQPDLLGRHPHGE